MSQEILHEGIGGACAVGRGGEGIGHTNHYKGLITIPLHRILSIVISLLIACDPWRFFSQVY